MATPEELAEQARKEAEKSKAGAIEGMKSILSAPARAFGIDKPDPTAPGAGVTQAGVEKKRAEATRQRVRGIQAEQQGVAEAEREAILRQRAETADRQRAGFPTAPPTATLPEEDDKTKPQSAGSVTSQFSRSGTDLRAATLQAEREARIAELEAGKEQIRLEAAFAGQSADITEALLANVKEKDDEVYQLAVAANERQARRMQAIEQLIDEGRGQRADPTAFFGSQKAAAGFQAGMAVAAGHLASALGGGPNTALKIIDKAVERQLRSDMFNIAQATQRDAQAMNLLDKWRQLTQDELEARNLAKLSLIQQAKLEVRAQVSRMEESMVDANVQALEAALLKQEAELMRRHDELQKTSYSRQIHNILPAVVAERDARLEAERAAAAQPQETAVQTATGTEAALISAIGRRGTFDTEADVQVGGASVPSSIVAPEFLPETPGQAVTSGLVRTVGAQEIFDTAFEQAEGNDRQKNRAAGQAIVDAGIEELEALWASGVTDQVGLKAAWDQSEVLRETFPDWRDMTPKTREQEHDLGGVRYFEVKPPPKKLTGESYSEGLATIARGNQVLPELDNLEVQVDDLRRALGAVRRADGSIDIDRLDGPLRERVLRYQDQMNEVFSVVRTMNKSGALQGPGEAQLFRDMSFIPDKLDTIVDLIAEGDNMKAALRTQRDMVRRFVDVSPGLLGLKNAHEMMADPDEVGDRLRANRAQ